MSAPTFADVQAAIQRWIVAATGIATDRVRWANQGGAVPASSGGAWVSLNIIAEGAQGSPWIDIEDASDPEAGADVEFVARSQNAGTLSIQIFNAPAVGASCGLALARRLEPSLRFPTIETIAAGVVGFGAFEPARDVPALINTTTWEPRTVIECRFFTAAEIRMTAPGELGTYIEHVEITNETET